MDPKNIDVLRNRHAIIKQEYGNLFKVYISLEEELKEHSLVISTIKDLPKDRKCWRMIGGALVERTVGEVLPALESKVKDELEVKIKTFYEKMNQKEKELSEIENELGGLVSKDNRLDLNNKAISENNKGVLA